MRIVTALLALCALAATVFIAGCNKEEEVGYGGEVKTAPGGAVPPGKGKPPTPSVD